MNDQDALSFLKDHQPMPPDTEMPTSLIQTYNEVRKHFAAHPSIEAAALFLSSFGEGDGFGVYMLVDEVLNAFSADELAPIFVTTLLDPSKSVRYWSADLAAGFPNPALISPLTELLKSNDDDLRSSAVIALGEIDDPRATQILRLALDIEDSPDLRQLLIDMVGSHKT